MIVIDKLTKNKIRITEDILKMYPDRYVLCDFDIKNITIEPETEQETEPETPQKKENNSKINHNRNNKKQKK
jgi:hypothetical protein